MIRTSKLWLVAGGALFTAVLLYSLMHFAPASLIITIVEHASDDRLTVAGATGRIWAGRGVLTSRVSGARVLIGWTLSPQELYALRLRGEIGVGSSAPSRFVATRGAVELDAIDIVLPAGLLAEALGPLGGYGVGGTVHLTSKRSVFHRDSAAARLTLGWRDATSTVIAVAPLGSYLADVEWISGAGSIRVRSTAGPLLLEGVGGWSHTGAALTLDARVSGDKSEALKGWLKTMTPELPDGRFRFVWPAPEGGSRSFRDAIHRPPSN